MSVQTSRFTVGQAGDVIVPAGPTPRRVLIKNKHASVSIDLFGLRQTATSGQGWEVEASTSTPYLDVGAGEGLQAIAPSGQSVPVEVYVSGVFTGGSDTSP